MEKAPAAATSRSDDGSGHRRVNDRQCPADRVELPAELAGNRVEEAGGVEDGGRVQDRRVRWARM